MAETPFAVTISRKLGSGGAFLGHLLARRLRIRLLDRVILHQAARELGMSHASLEAQEDRPQGFFERTLMCLAMGAPDAPYVPPLDLPVYSRDLFEVEARTMRRFLDQASAVVIGRGAFIALKGRPATLHVQLHAPLEFRVKRILERDQAPSRAEAFALCEQSDRARAAFLREVGGVDWRDSSNFDLCLDTSRLGFETCADLVTAALESLKPQAVG